MKLIDNIENVVCSAETMTRHSELYHYTKPDAFYGITGSQTLWCSHFRDMSDTEEIELMRNLLPPAIAPRMDAIMDKLNRHHRRKWNHSGRGANTARELVNELYGATYDGNADYSNISPYLFSFTTHSEDTDFDREHGIRSQWDNYAGPEGFCLVFDIVAVAQMLKNEGNARYWAWLMLEPVRYADSPVDKIFPELVDGLTDTLREFICGIRLPEVAVPQFLLGTTLLKGAQYKSEREVRIVAIPGSGEMARCAAKEYPDQFDATMPLPNIKTRPDGRRYIPLFEGMCLRLPIKRVIVGPGAGQEERAARVRSFFHEVPVTISCCP